MIDKLGREVKEGNIVAVSHRNKIHVCRILKINPKTITVSAVGNKMTGNRIVSESLKNPDQFVLLEGEDAMAYVLKNA